MKRILVMSEPGSLYAQVSRLIAEMAQVEVEVEERPHMRFNSLPQLITEWQVNPDKWDAAIFGYPHTDQTRLYVHQWTMEAKAATEGYNVVLRVPGDQLLLKAHDSRAYGISHALELSGVEVGTIKRGLVIGEHSPAAVAAWACSGLGITDIEVYNSAGRTPPGEVPGAHGVKEVGGYYGLIINSMRPGGIGSGGVYTTSSIPETILDPNSTVMEVVYNPRNTPLTKLAIKIGCLVVPGFSAAVFRTHNAFVQLFPEASSIDSTILLEKATEIFGKKALVA